MLVTCEKSYRRSRPCPTDSEREGEMARVIYLEDAVETFINGPSKIDKDKIIYLLNRIPGVDIQEPRIYDHSKSVLENIRDGNVITRKL